MSGLLDEWVRAMRGGDHAGAWAVSERAVTQQPPLSRDDPALPYHLRWVWDERELAGRDVLVRCYHGLGDSIQFLRFLPELRRRAASVTLEIQPRLITLLGDDPPADRVVPFDVAHPLPPAQCDIEIMELSFALRAPPASFSTPYLQVEPTPLPPKAIGICCQAGDWDESRSLPPELLAPLCAGHTCFTLDPKPSALAVRNPEGCPYDIGQTAALVAGMSLVITVDTMIAHLAGAMNKPTWLLLKHDPDWRWPVHGDRSEWYPAMRLYRQRDPHDWAEIAEAVQRDLAEMFPQGRHDCPSAPVSWGELLDKITILQIKYERIDNTSARANVASELTLLRAIAGEALRDRKVAAPLARLQAVNEDLWEIEDRIREHEAAGDFGPRFVHLARSVYRQNDLRAALKREISQLLGSALVEEKSYTGWSSASPPDTSVPLLRQS
jgi:hypothetical protein